MTDKPLLQDPARERRACLDLLRLWNCEEKSRRRKKIHPANSTAHRGALAHPDVSDPNAIVRRMEKRED